MIPVVPPPSLRTLLLDWSLDPAVALWLAAAAGAYLLGLRRLAGSKSARSVPPEMASGNRELLPGEGRAPEVGQLPGGAGVRPPWPRGRTSAFLGGLAVALVATSAGMARYDTTLFSVHAVQHVLLGMVTPALLALGAPVTLALQASSRPVQTTLVRLLHSRAARVVGSPVVAWVLFGGTLFGLYLTPLFELSLRDDLVHAAVHLHFIAVGALFCWAAIGVDPVPRRLPHGGRLLFVLLAVPVHAVLGFALLGSTQLLGGGFYGQVVRSWGGSALADQRTGVGIMWAAGELFGLALAGVVLAQWMRHDERVAVREDRRDDARRAGAGLQDPRRSVTSA